MTVEDCFRDPGIPVNSIEVLNRLIELLQEHKTDTLSCKEAQEDLRIRKCMWLLIDRYSLFNPDQEPHTINLWAWRFDEYKRIKSLEKGGRK